MTSNEMMVSQSSFDLGEKIFQSFGQSFTSVAFETAQG
jgi:hypothetical protein